MIVVQKFGGTCLDSPDKRELVCERVEDALRGGFGVLAVVSAMGRRGEPYATDTLINIAKNVCTDMAPREMDLLMSCGEIVSAVLMVQELQSRGVPAMALSGGQAGIITDTNFGEANILAVDISHVKRHLDEGKVVVVAGFQGRAESGDITTLGRGGSDTTATALGAALDASYVEIFTDVEGIMTADPRLVEDARTISLASYEEVSQLAWEGAKVIHPRAIQIAQRSGLPIWIRSLSKDSRKTLVTGGAKHDKPWASWGNGKPVTGITYRTGIVQMTVRLPESCQTEVVMTVFDVLKDVTLDLINVSLDSVSAVAKKDDLAACLTRLGSRGIDCEVRENVAKITVVGYGMHGVPGIMNTVVKALGLEKIPVYASCDSNITISCLIPEDSLVRAVNVVHRSFNL